MTDAITRHEAHDLADDPDAFADVLDDARAHTRFLDEEEGKQLFDGAARYYMGISGKEFLRRWDAGEWQDDPDHYPIMALVMLIPFARP